MNKYEEHNIEEHNIEGEDLENFIINILDGIKFADEELDARYILKLDRENVHRIAQLYKAAKWIEIY